MTQLPRDKTLLREWLIEHPQAGYGEFVGAGTGLIVSKGEFRRHKYEVRHPGRKAEARLQRQGKEAGHNLGVPASFVSDKKIGQLDFWEIMDWMKKGQKLKQKASWSQDFARIEFPDATEPICVLPISDTHMGSWSTDYALLETVTREILDTPNLYVMLVGDLNQMAIKLRGVAEVADNLLQPEMQDVLVDKWTDLFLTKVLCASWDNHAVQRQENQAGYSAHAAMLKRKVVYFPHIGHVDLVVGKQTYKIAVSHRFRGSSYLNPLHAQARYMRMEGLDREICVQGDTHTPGMSVYFDGPLQRMAINCGSTQTNSSFGKRYFSLFTHPLYPCFVLDPLEHEATPYKSLGAWRRAIAESVIAR